jgi:hypothetical protein
MTMETKRSSFVEMDDHLEKSAIAEHTRLDKHGFPLVPQPTEYPDDPLVCTWTPEHHWECTADGDTELVCLQEIAGHSSG